MRSFFLIILNSVRYKIQFLIIQFQLNLNTSYINVNFSFFKTMFKTYLKPDTSSEPSQRFKVEFLQKQLKTTIFFSKALRFGSLTRFWICLFLQKYSLTCRVTSRYILLNAYIFRTLSIIVNSDIFRHIHVLFRQIQSYCGIFTSLCNSYIFRTQPFSESWHI